MTKRQTNVERVELVEQTVESPPVVDNSVEQIQIVAKVLQRCRGFGAMHSIDLATQSQPEFRKRVCDAFAAGDMVTASTLVACM